MNIFQFCNIIFEIIFFDKLKLFFYKVKFLILTYLTLSRRNHFLCIYIKTYFLLSLVYIYNKNIMIKYKNCRICNSNNIETVIKFEKTPIGDAWKKVKKKFTTFYPLNIFFCKKCRSIQLKETISEKKIYNNFFYEISVTSGLKEHYKKFSEQLTKKYFKENKKYKILDIGSNDGSFLFPFSKKKFFCLGIEPTKHIARKANSRKIHTLNIFLIKKTQ